MNDIGGDSYGSKEDSYFRNVRHEVIPHFSPKGCSILEVGCGEGATLRYLKEHCGAAWTGGIEIHAPAAHVASEHLDWIHVGDIEASGVCTPGRAVDVLLLLDVLEHLRDPWSMLSSLVSDVLKPGGTVVVTLPNIRNARVIGRLLAFGDWRYEEVGILDRTHLRFFTLRTGLELMSQAGLVDVLAQPLAPRRLRPSWRALRALRLDEFASSQILFRARRPV